MAKIRIKSEQATFPHTVELTNGVKFDRTVETYRKNFSSFDETTGITVSAYEFDGRIYLIETAPVCGIYQTMGVRVRDLNGNKISE